MQPLPTYGLLRGSFRPDEDMCALRASIRHRDTLIRSRSAHVQPRQQALLLMPVPLTHVLSDITGVTGLQIIRAILQGERDPHTLAAYRNEHCAKREADMANAVTGNDRPEHLCALQQAREVYDFYHQQLTACDQEIAQRSAAFTPPVNLLETPVPSRTPRRTTPTGNEPAFDGRRDLYRWAGVDLTHVDGWPVLTVQTILSEIGLARHRWPTVKHVPSWLGLAPSQDISGGKTLRTSTKKTTTRAATAFRLAAQRLHSSHSALGGFYRRMRANQGAPKAIVATAHTRARIVSHLLTYRADSVDPGADDDEEKYRDRALRNLKRKARQLGLDLVPVTAQPSDGSHRHRCGTLWGMARPVPSLRLRSSPSPPPTRWPISPRLSHGQFPAQHVLSPTSLLVEFLSRQRNHSNLMNSSLVMSPSRRILDMRPGPMVSPR